MRTILKALLITTLISPVGIAEAVPQFYPYVIESRVTTSFRPTTTGLIPLTYGYNITYLGQLMAQGNIPLNASIQSLIAAGNIYSLDQTNVCNTVSQIIQTPDGSPIQVHRKNYIFIPPNTTTLVSESLTEC